MNEKKYVVPEGMMRAFIHAENHKGTKWDEGVLRAMLTAALCWWAENPLLPTVQQACEMAESCGDLMRKPNVNWGGSDCVTFYAVEWQRRMFLAPEPEIPEALKDLLQGDRFGDPVKPQITTNKAWDEAILEAYRRGSLSHDEKKK